MINYVSVASDERASELAKELEKTHSIKAVAIRADIATEDGCAKLIKDAKEHLTNPKTDSLQIDILVHNAGLVSLAPLGSVKVEDFHTIYATNVLGPILLTQAALPYLPHDRSGRIVMMSSVGSKIGTPDNTIYAGSKSALEGMTRVWARELAERATVNAINPGPVMTDMYLAAPEDIRVKLSLWNPVTPLVAVRDEDSEVAKQLGARLGGRAAYDWEVAGMVATLCSPEAGWCTGSVVSANGGMAFST